MIAVNQRVRVVEKVPIFSTGVDLLAGSDGVVLQRYDATSGSEALLLVHLDSAKVSNDSAPVEMRIWLSESSLEVVA